MNVRRYCWPLLMLWKQMKIWLKLRMRLMLLLLSRLHTTSLWYLDWLWSLGRQDAIKENSLFCFIVWLQCLVLHSKVVFKSEVSFQVILLFEYWKFYLFVFQVLSNSCCYRLEMLHYRSNLIINYLTDFKPFQLHSHTCKYGRTNWPSFEKNRGKDHS